MTTGAARQDTPPRRVLASRPGRTHLGLSLPPARSAWGC